MTHGHGSRQLSSSAKVAPPTGPLATSLTFHDQVKSVASSSSGPAFLGGMIFFGGWGGEGELLLLDALLIESCLWWLLCGPGHLDLVFCGKGRRVGCLGSESGVVWLQEWEGGGLITLQCLMLGSKPHQLCVFVSSSPHPILAALTTSPPPGSRLSSTQPNLLTGGWRTESAV